MGLKPNDKQSLLEAATKGFSSYTVDDNGDGLVAATDADRILAIVGRCAGEWIEAHDASFIIKVAYGFRLQKAAQQEARKKEVPGSVHAVPSELAQRLAEELVEWVDRLPFDFSFYFPLPALEPFGTDRLELASNVELIRVPVKDGLFDRISTTSSDKPKHSELVRGLAYLRVKSKGYAFLGHSSESAVTGAFSTAQRFLALAEVVGAFRRVYGREKTLEWTLGDGSPLGGGELVAARIPPNVGDVLSDYRLGSGIIHRPAGLLDDQSSWKTGVAVSEADRARRLVEQMTKARNVLDADPAAAGVSNLHTAAEWYFDAIAEPNDTLQLVKTCIGFEALLGDEAAEEGRGIKAMLADRVAFVLGENAAARNDLRKRFKKYYEVRSKLVHGRAPRLRGDDRDLRFWGVRTLGRALQKEVERN